MKKTVTNEQSTLLAKIYFPKKGSCIFKYALGELENGVKLL